jgi:hypothetical protein
MQLLTTIIIAVGQVLIGLGTKILFEHLVF